MKDYLGHELKPGDIVTWGETAKSAGVTMTWGIIVKKKGKLVAVDHNYIKQLYAKRSRCRVTLVHPALYTLDMIALKMDHNI